jgi:hypothetical protein
MDLMPKVKRRRRRRGRRRRRKEEGKAEENRSGDLHGRSEGEESVSVTYN